MSTMVTVMSSVPAEVPVATTVVEVRSPPPVEPGVVVRVDNGTVVLLGLLLLLIFTYVDVDDYT